MCSFLQDTPVKKTATEGAVSTVSTASTSWVKAPNRPAAESGHQVAPHPQPFVLGESSRDSIIFGNVCVCSFLNTFKILSFDYICLAFNFCIKNSK
jgi:hypothetical protein